MTIVCVDNTPIMLQTLKESAGKAYPYADVRTFLPAESALDHIDEGIFCFFPAKQAG